MKQRMIISRKFSARIHRVQSLLSQNHRSPGQLRRLLMVAMLACGLASSTIFCAITAAQSEFGDESSIDRFEPQAPVNPPTPSINFATSIQPLFEAHCQECHGATKQESNLRLDVRERAFAAGDWGAPAIVPGNSADSLMFQFISGTGDLLMPPENRERLAPDQVDLIRRWIDEGANWPDELAGSEDQPLTTDHWAFQPIKVAQPPELNAPKTLATDGATDGAIDGATDGAIDRFIYQRLIENQLSPSPPADRAVWIRRAYLDMIGLLPTPTEVEAFVQDSSTTAYQTVIDRLLASPHYGERWARHWLDVVRFGESTGFEVNQERPNAFYYRDYVIDALNSDKPYTEFVKEQIAGDAFGVDEATGFLVGGPYDTVKSPDVNLTMMQRQDELADFVNTTATTFLGLTVGCARCHNHKFDPILQRDYYALQAVFAGVEHGERKLHSRETDTIRQTKTQAQQRLAQAQERLQAFFDSIPTSDSSEGRQSGLLPRINSQKNIERFAPRLAKMVRFTIQQTNLHEPCLDELEIFGPTDPTNLALASTGAVASSSGDYQGNPKHQLSHLNDGLYGNDRSWIANRTEGAWVQIELTAPQEISQIVWGRDRNGQFDDRVAARYLIETSLDGEHWELAARSSQHVPLDYRYLEYEELAAQADHANLAELKSLVRQIETAGNELQELNQVVPTAYVGTFKAPVTIHRLHRGDPFAPREEVLPDVLSVMGSLELDSSTPEQERRRRLALWIASDQNPLTARVIVNRVWHYHFGRGLVLTTSDFGKNGSLPTHPQLLDWLADQFMAHGWSLKWLHRQIMLSSTYQQSSAPRTEALAIDAQSRFLWRFPPRRLEAEAIRDCVLQVSGKLNRQARGKGFLLFEVKKETVHHYSPLRQFEADHFRRMIYMTKIRQEQDDVFGVFDCPDGGQAIANRNQSTTALQALNLLNSPFVLEQADFLAQRLQQQAGTAIEAQVELAWQWLFCRLPTPEETQDSLTFIEQHGLVAFCRAILNANEFLYLG